MSIEFLNLEEVLEIHHEELARNGGQPGIRDRGLLLSALAQPEATFGGMPLHPTIHAMAGAYTYHLIQNHPFVDGNKRVGITVGGIFLRLNGWKLIATNDELLAFTLGVASSQIPKAGVEDFFLRNTYQVPAI